MKRIISVIALVLAMTMVMSVSAFAAKSFSVDAEDVTVEDMTVTANADSLDVTVPTTSGADYSILLVAGNTLPTVDSAIAYINQANATGESLNFDVLPLMSVAESAASGALTLYIGSNATGFELISVPVAYLEQVTNDYITSADTSKATIAADVASNGVAVPVSDASMGDVVGKYIISLALDNTAYPNAGAETAGYIVKAVNADGTDVTDATVYYSKERKKYVALIPGTTADYKFEVIANGTEGAVANEVIVRYGSVNDDAAGVINAPDFAQFKQVYLATNKAVKKVILSDVSGDGKVNAPDFAQFKKAYLGDATANFNVLKK